MERENFHWFQTRTITSMRQTGAVGSVRSGSFASCYDCVEQRSVAPTRGELYLPSIAVEERKFGHWTLNYDIDTSLLVALLQATRVTTNRNTSARQPIYWKKWQNHVWRKSNLKKKWNYWRNYWIQFLTRLCWSWCESFRHQHELGFAPSHGKHGIGQRNK